MSKKSYEIMKRVFDIFSCTTALSIIWPFMAAVAIAIRLESSGPVIYRGIRSGQGGRTFEMFKFRTMVVNAETIGGPSTALNDPRLTRVGKLLRRYKLDELPQLINVLLGDMSVVGPRPEVPQYTKLYKGEQKEILSVRPGITDYSSIEFANLQDILGSEDVDLVFETSVMPRKTELRMKYIRNRSFLEDLRIIFKTFARLISK